MALVWPKIDLFHQTVRTINVHNHERARVIATQLQSLGPKLARGYTASKCSSRYLLMKIVLPDSNVTLLRDRLTVKPCYRQALAIILPHPFLVRFILCFTFLCLTGCSLADAERLLFIIGYRDGHLLAV